jgi:hypothetical protein
MNSLLSSRDRSSRRAPRRSVRCAHGTVYLIVLSTVTLVAAISVTGLTLAQAQRRTASMVGDTEHARSLALSGIEAGVQIVNSLPTWRSRTGPSGSLVSFSLGPGRVSVSAVDSTGTNPMTGAADQVDLAATADVGQARQTMAVRLRPEYTPMGVLLRGIHAGAALSIDDADIVSTMPIASNMSINAGDSSVLADAESLLITGSTFHADRRILASWVPMPVGVVNTYAAIATEIPRAVIGGNDFKDLLLTPTSNPFGVAPNSRGVYVINCAGTSLIIRNVRIVGTLVLQNPGPNTRLLEGIMLEPAIPGFPALIVDGPLQISLDGRAIEEDGKVNFNPQHTPIKGLSNLTNTDTYTSGITGVVYASGAITFNANLALQGSLIAGTTMSVRGTLTIGRYLDTLTFPPPGFRDRMVMAVVPGSWLRMVDVK